MNDCARAQDLAAAYEALRAQATGQLPATTPRGLALCLRAGLPAWMKSLAPVPALPAVAASVCCADSLVHAPDDVVRLLTEMAFACWQGSAA